MKEEEKFNEGEFNKFKEKRIQLEIEFKLKQVIKNITNDRKDINGMSCNELENRLKVATNDLIKEIENRVEFHLSLNPPKYLIESNGKLEIDYMEIRKILPKQNQKSKQLKSPKKDMSDENNK